VSLGNAFKNFLYHASVVAAIGMLLTARRTTFMHYSALCMQFWWAVFQHFARK
jgi:hypothetical protein